MRRYMAFSGKSFYADGGWLDCRGASDDLGEAVALAKAQPKDEWDKRDWWHVVDAHTGEIVDGVGGSYCGSNDDWPKETT